MPLLEPDGWDRSIYLDGFSKGGGGDYAVVEPATGAELGRVGMAAPDDVDRAARRGAEVQRAWAAAPYAERSAVLRRAGDLFTQHADEIRDWLVREAGSTQPKGDFELHVVAGECYEAAALASAPFGEVLRTEQPRLSLSRQVPVGIVGVIAPFNFPLILSVRAVAAALALGNAVVLKPDPRTAVCGGIVIARVLEEAGLPAGLFSVLPGAADVGEALVTHPLVRVIAFTGSSRAGRAVGALAGQHLKRAHLELGGNSALIVMDDVDVERAASLGAFGSFLHQGQICMTTGRHIVSDRIVDDYVAELAARADRLVVGDPMKGQVHLGPIIDDGQRDKIHELVTTTVGGGATLAAGGTYDERFYRPTVLSGVTPDSPAYAEEVFGPVAPVIGYGDLEEAVALAAGSDYGLSLGILTGDGLRALELAERIPTGAIHINDQTVGDEPVIPFGGVGLSGAGSRTGGTRANLDAYTETQWVTAQSRLPESPF